VEDKGTGGYGEMTKSTNIISRSKLSTQWKREKTWPSVLVRLGPRLFPLVGNSAGLIGTFVSCVRGGCPPGFV